MALLLIDEVSRRTRGGTGRSDGDGYPGLERRPLTPTRSSGITNGDTYFFAKKYVSPFQKGCEIS